MILADEPTGNLDTANGDRVMEILQRLAHEEGYCVVVVTHDMSIAEAADQVLEDEGRRPGRAGDGLNPTPGRQGAAAPVEQGKTYLLLFAP